MSPIRTTILPEDDIVFTLDRKDGVLSVDHDDFRVEFPGRDRVVLYTQKPCPNPYAHIHIRPIRSLVWEATKRFIGGYW